MVSKHLASAKIQKISSKSIIRSLKVFIKSILNSLSIHTNGGYLTKTGLMAKVCLHRILLCSDDEMLLLLE